jgi:hypothetical protein
VTFFWVQNGLVAAAREESVLVETPDSSCSVSARWTERRNPLVDVAGVRFVSARTNKRHHHHVSGGSGGGRRNVGEFGVKGCE